MTLRFSCNVKKDYCYQHVGEVAVIVKHLGKGWYRVKLLTDDEEIIWRIKYEL